MLFKKLRVRIRFLLLSVIVVALMGCASAGSFTPSGTPVTDILEALEKGEIRFTCEISCSGAWGSNRHEMRQFHNVGLWHDLALKVVRIGYRSELSYYYLGRSAEGLGYNEAARTYYRLAKSSLKCDGFFNVCDGFVFPQDIDKRFDRLDEKSAAEKIAAEEAQAERVAVEKAERVAAERAAIEEAKETAQLEKVTVDKSAKKNTNTTEPVAQNRKKTAATLCKAIEGITGTIIEKRQQGVAISDLYEMMLDMADSKSTQEAMIMQEVVSKLLITIYETPLPALIAQEDEIKNTVFISCMKGTGEL